MTIRVATLGLEGLTGDLDKMIDYLMCCWFYSKHSQSTIYRGRVSSLMKIIQLYPGDAVGLRQGMEDSLSKFLKRWFNSVTVTVYEEGDGDEPGINLRINAMISPGDDVNVSAVSVGYSLLTNNSELKRLVNLSNGVSMPVS